MAPSWAICVTPLTNLFSLHAVQKPYPGEMFRREGGNSLIGKLLSRRAHRVLRWKRYRIKDADDIARIGFLHDMPVLGHHLLRLGQTHLFVSLHIGYTSMPASNLPEQIRMKSDPVPVRPVHIGLNLKNKGGELLFHGVDHPRSPPFWAAAKRSSPGNASGKSPHRSWSAPIRKIPETGVPRSLPPDQIPRWPRPEARSPPAAVPSDPESSPRRFWNLPAQSPPQRLPSFLHGVGENQHLLRIPVIHAPECFSGADGPVHRTGGNPSSFSISSRQLKGIVGIPVQLVDESKNRGYAAWRRP